MQLLAGKQSSRSRNNSLTELCFLASLHKKRAIGFSQRPLVAAVIVYALASGFGQSGCFLFACFSPQVCLCSCQAGNRYAEG